MPTVAGAPGIAHKRRHAVEMPRDWSVAAAVARRPFVPSAMRVAVVVKERMLRG